MNKIKAIQFILVMIFVAMLASCENNVEEVISEAEIKQKSVNPKDRTNNDVTVNSSCSYPDPSTTSYVSGSGSGNMYGNSNPGYSKFVRKVSVSWWNNGGKNFRVSAINGSNNVIIRIVGEKNGNYSIISSCTVANAPNTTISHGTLSTSLYDYVYYEIVFVGGSGQSEFVDWLIWN